MRMIIIGLSCLLGACTVADYLPNSQVVVVDGEEFSVRPLASANAFQATVNRPSAGDMMVIRPERYAQNVRAIEAATGCSVIRETVQNRDSFTNAAVVCAAT